MVNELRRPSVEQHTLKNSAPAHSHCKQLVVMTRLVSADLLLRTRGDEVKSRGMTGEALGYTVHIQTQFQTTTQFCVAYMTVSVSHLELVDARVKISVACRTRE